MMMRGRKIEYPARLPKSERDLFVSPVAAVDGRLVRPADVLVDADREGELEAVLTRNDFTRYDPERGDPRSDFRKREGAPPYGDINRRLQEKGAGFRLWTGPGVETTVELVEGRRRVPGLTYNHVLVGEDFYHGGPGGPPVAAAGPGAGALREPDGDGIADIAVLDNGMPHDWEELHGELRLVVDRLGKAALPLDPLDEGPPDGVPDGVLDKQAGHGLFICGLIARVAPSLNIQLHRVLHASGEGDESLIGDTLLGLLGSSVKVINLSLGAYLPNDETRLAGPIRRLKDEGKIIVASAGNAGGTRYGPGPLFPARLPEVIAVGAYDSTKHPVEVWRHSCHGDIYAPGVDVLSSHVAWEGPIDWEGVLGNQSFKGWATWSGTSFAAPLVAAALAEELTKVPAGSAEAVANAWLAARSSVKWPNRKGVTPARRYDPAKPVTHWV